MLTAEDLKPSKEKLPTKEERKQAQAEQEQYQEYHKKLSEICLEFFNDKISNLDIPVAFIEEQIPTMMRSYIKIQQCKTKEFKDFLEAKRKLEETAMNNLTELSKDELDS